MLRILATSRVDRLELIVRFFDLFISCPMCFFPYSLFRAYLLVFLCCLISFLVCVCACVGQYRWLIEPPLIGAKPIHSPRASVAAQPASAPGRPPLHAGGRPSNDHQPVRGRRAGLLSKGSTHIHRCSTCFITYWYLVSKTK